MNARCQEDEQGCARVQLTMIAQTAASTSPTDIWQMWSKEQTPGSGIYEQVEERAAQIYQ